MSEEQHTADIKARLPHKESGAEDGTGGQCLNRHVALMPGEGPPNSCAHRWQARLQMEEDEHLYNWPRYQSLVGKGKVKTAQKDGYPEWYSPTIGAPTKNSWDIDEETMLRGQPVLNFWMQCYIPYWHEAHHMVPNSTLRGEIAKLDGVVRGLTRRVRRGLLEEGYNLNEKDNMIMLPMDREVAAALKLPAHRRTAKHRHHSNYDAYVKQELEPILSQVAGDAVEHEEPDYEACMQQIKNLSVTLWNDITDPENAEEGSLDEMIVDED